MRSVLLVLALTACQGDDDGLATDPFDLESYAGLPSADAGEDQELTEGSQVELVGVADDTDGQITATAWRVIAGAELPELSVDGDTARFIAPPTKDRITITLRFTATDNDGWTQFDDVDVVVLPVNTDPTVHAGEDDVAVERSEYLLSASAEDSDGFITAWTWEQTGGPLVTLGNLGAPATSFRTPEVDEDTPLTFLLTVADDEGGTATDEVVITIQDDNDPPSVTANADQTVNEGSDVLLIGDAIDLDSPIAAVGWTQIGGPTAVLESTSPTSARFTAPSVDQSTALTFRLSATDDQGATAWDDTIVVVTPYDAPPSVYAGADFSATERTTVELVGSADDVDGTVVSWQWSQLGGVGASLGTPQAPQTLVTLPDVSSTTAITFRLTVTDDGGNTVHDDVVVTVQAINAPPVVEAGLDRTVRIGEQVSLNASAYDTDGAIVEHAWRQVSGPSVTLSDTTLPTTQFTAPIVATDTPLVFEYTARDDAAAAATDTVTITVRSALAPPTVDAGASRFARGGELLVIEPVVEDPDNNIVSWNWEQLDGPTVSLLSTTQANTGFQVPETLCGDWIRLRLTVTDADGLSASDDIGIALIGSDHASRPVNALLDFETGDDDVFALGTVWELGLPTSGPGAAYSGVRAWGTNLGGNSPLRADDTLCLPLFDLSTSLDPALVLAGWVRGTGPDALSIQVLTADAGWAALSETSPNADLLDPSGRPGFGELGYDDAYEIVGASLADVASSTTLVRLNWQSDNHATTAGAYVDLVGVYDAESDPDNDGLPGVLDELIVHRSDPFNPDSDGDGVLDGAEVDAGSSPNNPAWLPETTAWQVDHLETLQGGPGGLATTGTLWQYGTPQTGPMGGHTGIFAWGTNLAGNYSGNQNETLYFPPLDLTEATEPWLTFRLHATMGSQDAMRIEVRRPGDDWEPLSSNKPTYDATDPLGQPGWGNHGYRTRYTLAALDLSDHSGRMLEMRAVFRSNNSGHAAGAYIDDIGLHEASSDPDGDGVVGIAAEWLGLGTDPFIADTDGDGASDGEEQSDNTGPLNPSWAAHLPPLTRGTTLDFEDGPDGAATLPWNVLWEHGVVRSGPGTAFSGTRAWGTDYDGSYFGNAFEPLYLPVLDLGSTTSPVLTARIYSRINGGDGWHLQIEQSGQWLEVEPTTPAYNVTAGGVSMWRDIGYQSDWELAVFDLSPFAGVATRARFVFESDNIYVESGAFIDDIALWDDSDDADGDGIVGVVSELLQHGTDPLIADSDGDGTSDGSEVSAGSSPLNPADTPSANALRSGDRLDFESGAQGVGTVGKLWKRGAPTSGPSRAHSGNFVWATNLAGTYFNSAYEPLYLPPVAIDAGSEPVLLVRAHLRVSRTEDGITAEVRDAAGAWSVITPDEPPYDGALVDGWPGWNNLGYRNNYHLLLLPLPDETPGPLFTRLMFRSDYLYWDSGAYIDDLIYTTEADDYDGDGLIGAMNELATWGTDPTLADTDGDGVDDGDEVSDGTDPLNPALFAGAVVWSVGSSTDFESGTGGLAPGNDRLWALGTPSSGVNGAASGTKAWGTVLNGPYPNGAVEHLYLPAIDLSEAASAALTFNAYIQTSGSDGLVVEARTNGAWQALTDVSPAFDGSNVEGLGAWENLRDGSNYVPAQVDLSAFAGQVVAVRFALRTNSIYTGSGAYIDDLAVIAP